MVVAKLKDGTEIFYEDPGDEPELTEEEEHVIDVLFEHPTRDDVHEQREPGQVREAVIHAHFHVVVRR